MAVRLQVRNGTASEWTTADPVLMEGELGAELDTGKFKIGDGVNEWSKLGYAPETPVVDALDSTSTTSALSAKQGSVLAGMIGDIGSALDTINGEVV